jgi:hypothetical protein
MQSASTSLAYTVRGFLQYGEVAVEFAGGFIECEGGVAVTDER